MLKLDRGEDGGDGLVCVSTGTSAGWGAGRPDVGIA